MKYKEFVKWCNDRACDGMWELCETIICIGVMKDVNKKPFWKREKEWERINSDGEIEKIVSETNVLIKQALEKMKSGDSK